MVESQRAGQQQQQHGAAETPRGGGAGELLGDIGRRVRLPPTVTAEDALEAVLCALSQHASGSEARHVMNALPAEVRPELRRCSVHEADAVSRFDREELLRRIGEHLQVSPGDAEDIASAVLMAIGSRLAPDEVRQIADRLPLELRDLWAVRRAAAPVDPHPVLTQIERTVALPYGVTGVGAFSVVLGTLLRRLSKSEAIHLLERLPADLRLLVEPFVLDRSEAPEAFDAPHFLSRVAALSNVDDPEPVARAVLVSTQEYMRIDVLEHVMSQLPPDLRDLWDTSTTP